MSSDTAALTPYGIDMIPLVEVISTTGTLDQINWVDTSSARRTIGPYLFDRSGSERRHDQLSAAYRDGESAPAPPILDRHLALQKALQASGSILVRCPATVPRRAGDDRHSPGSRLRHAPDSVSRLLTMKASPEN